MSIYDDLLDNIIVDESPSETSDMIKNILYSKIADKIDELEPEIANAFFNVEEESDIDELYQGRHGQTETEYMNSRSDAGKRISGDAKSGPAAYTSRMYAKDPVTKPGSKPIGTPKLSSSEKDQLEIRRNKIFNK